MFKKLIIAAATAATLMGGFSTSAIADGATLGGKRSVDVRNEKVWILVRDITGGWSKGKVVAIFTKTGVAHRSCTQTAKKMEEVFDYNYECRQVRAERILIDRGNWQIGQ